MSNGDASVRIDGITKLIKEVGFPIVAFLLMFWLVVGSLEKQGDKTDKLAETVDKSTQALTALVTSQNQFYMTVQDDHLDMKNDLGTIKERTRP